MAAHLEKRMVVYLAGRLVVDLEAWLADNWECAKAVNLDEHSAALWDVKWADNSAMQMVACLVDLKGNLSAL